MTVTVHHSGSGVPDELRDSVFQEGFSTKGGQRLRGYGLALSRLACTRRGGTVTADNTAGSRFIATLPCVPPADGSPPPAGRVPAQGRPAESAAPVLDAAAACDGGP